MMFGLDTSLTNLFFFWQETLDALCDLYSLLKEEDMWAGLWQKRAKFTDTNTAIAYQQHGFFEQAQNSYEAVRKYINFFHPVQSIVKALCDMLLQLL